MIRLPTAAVTALGARLRERGSRSSLVLPTGPHGADDALDALIAETYGPICEAMYLVMAADGTIAAAERDVIRGALRELDDRIRTRHTETMLAAAAEALAREGWEARLSAVGVALGDDATRAEATLLLGAAVAYADGEIAAQESDVMTRLMASLSVSPARMQELVSSLERIDSVLESDPTIDATDVVVHAAFRLRTPEDFERLAARTDRPDVMLVLRVYASFVRSGDDWLERAEATPRSLSGAWVGALRTLVGALPAGRSHKLDDLRGALRRLATALETLDRAPALRPLLTGPPGEVPPVVELELALTRLGQIVGRALARIGEQPGTDPVPGLLRAGIEGAVQGGARGRDALTDAIDQTIAWAANAVPRALVAAVDLVMRHVATLPVDAPIAAPATLPSEPPLPEWVPKHRVLAGFYLHHPLAAGGTGTVFVASRSEERDDPSAPRFALKVPQYDAVAARAISEAEFLAVFKQEAGALLALPDHPNLAGFVTFDARARPKPVLVMELIEGIDVDVAMQRGALDGRSVVAILDGVLAGLSAMHAAGLGHLDLKPRNIVLRDASAPVLVDFGLAGRHVRVGCATPAYAAPEVWGLEVEGGTPSPFAADVYSFGCVAYELLSRRELFGGPHEYAIMAAHVQHDGGPAAIERLRHDPERRAIGAMLSACLRRSPKDRPGVDALRAELRALAPRIASLGWPCL